MSDFTFEGVEEGNFDDLPPGSYVCVIDDTETGFAKTGTPQLRVQFKVVLGDYKGRVISDFLYFTQAAAGIVLSKIKAAGIDDPPKGLASADAYAKEIGKLLWHEHAEIVVRMEEYNGETRAKVKGWKKPPSDLQLAAASNATASAPVDDSIPF